MNLRDQYHRDGYVIVPSCVAEADLVLNDIAQLFAQKIKGLKSFIRVNMKSLLDKDKESYLATLSACSKLFSAYELFVGNKLLKNIFDLHDAPVSIPLFHAPVLHVMSDELKIPDGYYGTMAHQDWPSVQGSLGMVTVWIPLMDIKRNFPLEVVPGSHLQGLREGKVNGSVIGIGASDKDFIPVQCNTGDAVLISAFTTHRTGRGHGFRIAVSARFENAADPEFILRGYPCAQKRTVDRDIHWKPTVEQVREAHE